MAEATREQGSFCPDCGSRLTHAGERPFCRACGFVLYRNQLTGVAVVLRDAVGNVLLGRRATGAYRGLWCIPCGYVEYDEHIRDGAVREMREETGLDVEVGSVLAVHSNFHRADKQTVGVWFSGELVGGYLHTADREFSSLAYVPPDSPPRLAFPTDALVLSQLAAADQRLPPDTDPLLRLAHRVARSAGDLVRRRLDSGITRIGTKSSDVDMVTDIDEASEKHIVAEILAVRPHDGILGEEGSEMTGSSGVRWIIDPVDGTTNLLYGVPAFAVVVAVEVGGVIHGGVVHDVTSDKTYWALRGRGAFCDGQRLDVSRASDLGTSLLATGFSYLQERRRQQAERLVRILPAVRDIRRLGSAALDLCRVASGEVDGYFEEGLNRWDYEAGVLIVREAGGRITQDEDGLIVATGPGIHDQLLELVH